MRRPVLVLSVLAASAAPAHARAETVLSPVGAWQASSQDGLCRVERRFEAAGAPHLVILEQTGPSHTFGMALAGPTLAALAGDKPVRLSFGAADPAWERRASIEANRQFGSVAIIRNIWLGAGRRIATGGAAVPDRSHIEPDLAAKADRIVVAQDGTRLTFASGSLADAAGALNGCTAPMLAAWGLDPEVQYNLKQTAEPLDMAALGKELKSAYPRGAQRALRSGPTEAVVMVDPAGAATQCRIIVPSGHEDLDQAACRAMTKARYRPALDAAGTPVASYWQIRINFAATQYEAQKVQP